MVPRCTSIKRFAVGSPRPVPRTFVVKTGAKIWVTVCGWTFASSSWAMWLPRTSYVLRRLRFQAVFDSLQSCRPSSFRCSTRFDFSSVARLAALGNHRAPTPTGRRQSIATPASSLHVGRSNPLGVALECMARAGARRSYRQTGDGHRVASPRFSPVLDLEKPTPHRRPGVPPDVRALILADQDSDSGPPSSLNTRKISRGSTLR
jgi:hypothetical protein